MVRSSWAALALSGCALFMSGCSSLNEHPWFSSFRTCSNTRGCSTCSDCPVGDCGCSGGGCSSGFGGSGFGGLGGGCGCGDGLAGPGFEGAPLLSPDGGAG